MQAVAYQYYNKEWHSSIHKKNFAETEAVLVLCFAAKSISLKEDIYNIIKEKFPKADIAICSTSGEIWYEKVSDESMSVVAFTFSQTKIQTTSVSVLHYTNSRDAGAALLSQLPIPGLTYVFVLSDGGLVNGSELVKGLQEAAPENVLITGGLAGDGANFTSTLVGLNASPAQGNIIAVGFYGNITVTHGTGGGWDMFGLEKIVTKSDGNILYELDDKNALDLYTRYLGPDADHLPGSALLFPLSVIVPDSEQPVTRTILSINYENKSMTFAGDIPKGSRVRFMKANLDKLTAAASTAAQNTITNQFQQPDFSLLISCVGRKLVLGSRTDEEVEAVQQSLHNPVIAGFYSYGEISPFNNGKKTQLHNQTMTITSFYEPA